MLGEEHYIVLLSSPSAIFQWHSRANGWYAQDHGSQNAQASKSRQRVVVICVSICRSYDERESSRQRMATSSIWSASWDMEVKSQSPIAELKGCNVTQAIGVAHSKIVLPSGDSKGESKNRTYCPTTWNNLYTWQYAAEYADQWRRVSRASALLCKECTLLVRIQLSRKNASHPNCAFAHSASTVMCGAMIS